MASLSEETALVSQSPSSLLRKGIYLVKTAVFNVVDKDKVRWRKMMQSLTVSHLAIKVKFESTPDRSLAREVD